MNFPLEIAATERIIILLNAHTLFLSAIGIELAERMMTAEDPTFVKFFNVQRMCAVHGLHYLPRSHDALALHLLDSAEPGSPLSG